MRTFLLLSLSTLALTAAYPAFAADAEKPATEVVTEKAKEAVEDVKAAVEEGVTEVKKEVTEVKAEAKEEIQKTKEPKAEEKKPGASTLEVKKEEKAEAKEEAKKEEKPAEEAKTPPPPQPKRLAEILSKEDDVQEFMKLLKKTGLDKMLIAENSQYTLFIPTDDAVDDFQDRVAEIEKSGNKQLLTDILNFHIVNGAIPRAALDNNNSEVLSTTLKRLRVIGKAGKLTVNGIKVDDKEIVAANGIIYKIAKVIDIDAPAPQTAGKQAETTPEAKKTEEKPKKSEGLLDKFFDKKADEKAEDNAE